ncbi:MAG: hypothetical protein QRY74_01835 [Chlamydia sp.]
MISGKIRDFMEANSTTAKKSPRKRHPRLDHGEVMTIVILFHVVGYRNFKIFYAWM